MLRAYKKMIIPVVGLSLFFIIGNTDSIWAANKSERW
jgi:hypothetical protein